MPIKIAKFPSKGLVAVSKAKAKAVPRRRQLLLQQQLRAIVTKTIPMTFTLPHMWFKSLFVNHRTLFDKMFCGEGGPLGVETFWKEVAGRLDPRIQNHDMLSRASWHKHALPIAFHGNGVACIRTGRSGSKSLDVFSWHGLLFRKATLFMKHLIVSIFTSSVTEGTMDAI